MPKRLVILATILGAFFLIPIMNKVLVGTSNAEEIAAFGAVQQAVSGDFVFSDNTFARKLTLENDNVKIVWHYGVLRYENNNRGGGNIYELYDKSTDPTTSRNIVGVVDDGTGGTGPPLIGFGGLGSTYFYGASVGDPATSDNGQFARLVDGSKQYLVDSSGNAVFRASFIVRQWIIPFSPYSPDNFRVDKEWTVFPSGQIKYQATVTLLRDITYPGISEPYYGFVFSREYGWTSAYARTHDRHDVSRRGPCQGPGSNGAENPANGGMVFNNIDSTNHEISDRNTPLGHTQAFTFYGQTGGVSVRVKPDNGGNGYEGGGLFAYGSQKWNGMTENVTSEFSNAYLMPDQAPYGLGHGYSIHWYGWWGGGAPPATRYKPAYEGDTWTDSFWIEMIHSDNPDAPVISNVTTDTEISTAEISWTTDVATDSRIEYWPSGSSERQIISSNDLTPSHKLLLNNLLGGMNYDYEVFSGDATNEAVASGSFTTKPGIYLGLDGDSVYWASFNDYVENVLSVDFTISNIGSEPFAGSELVAVTANLGVQPLEQSAELGDMPVGFFRQLTIHYVIPTGVHSFRTELFISGTDSQGNLRYYPRVP